MNSGVIRRCSNLHSFFYLSNWADGYWLAHNSVSIFDFRTVFLFCNLLLAIYGTARESSFWYRNRFILMSFTAWPIALAVNLFKVLYTNKYDIIYSFTYLNPVPCGLNYTFYVQGDECLLGLDGRISLLSSNIIKLVFIIITWVLLGTSVYLARKNYLKHKLQAQRETNNAVYEGGAGFSVAKQYSYQIYRHSLQFLFPSLIYTLAFLPVIFAQLYEIYTGPLLPHIHFGFAIYITLESLVVSIGNFVFYGILSHTFRSEMKRLFFKLTSKLRRIQTTLVRFIGSDMSVNNDDGNVSINSFEPYSQSGNYTCESEYD